MIWEKIHNSGGEIQDPKQIREILDSSAKKNNNLLIFFFTFGLYILISTLGTTDIALLLPRQGFKMPLIDFELDLLNFFILGPSLLLLLHFNLLFSHHKHLEKLHTYKNKVDINSIDPSLYSFAFMMGNHGFSGRMINIILWILLYILPLLVFLTIYIRFADYHHEVITPLHLGIIILDLIFIISSILYNDIFYKSRHTDRSSNIINSISKIIVYPFIIYIGVLTVMYYFVFFFPIVQDKDKFDPSYLEKIENDWIPKAICYHISKLISDEKKYCYPRLIVTEEEMAKISQSALYIPRHLVMDEIKEYKDLKPEEKEKKLILDYGTRIDLTNRNLRYANLKSSILTRADMKNSLFDDADLAESHMQAVKLDNASFIDANLRSAKLQSAELINTNLHGAKLDSANMNHASFTACNLADASMSAAQLEEVKFLKFNKPNNLTNTDLRHANLTNANFIGVDLTGASLRNTNISNTDFREANLTASDLSGTHFFVKIGKIKINHTDTNFLQGPPKFEKTKMFGINISKYKKEDNTSTKKQNTILFDINASEKDSDNVDISIYKLNPVVFDVNTSTIYPILFNEDIFRKYPDLFDVNISKEYPFVFDANISKDYPFVFDANIPQDYSTFHERRIIYLNKVIQKINEKNESTDKLDKLRDSSCEYVKNSACMYIKRENKNSEDKDKEKNDEENNDACRCEIDIIIKNKTSKSKTEIGPEDKYTELMTICHGHDDVL